jgi:hypothetical protein
MLLVALAACGGGGSVQGDPLIQSTLMAQFANKAWTPAYGFARAENDRFGLYIGDQKISCADDFMDEPRKGTYAFAAIPTATVGNYTNVGFTLLEVVTASELNSQGGTGGVMITAINETETSAVFSFSTTAGASQFLLTGAVTMLRCP